MISIQTGTTTELRCVAAGQRHFYAESGDERNSRFQQRLH